MHTIKCLLYDFIRYENWEHCRKNIYNPVTWAIPFYAKVHTYITTGNSIQNMSYVKKKRITQRSSLLRSRLNCTLQGVSVPIQCYPVLCSVVSTTVQCCSALVFIVNPHKATNKESHCPNIVH